MKPLLCMHVGPEVSRYDDVMLSMYREVCHAARRRRRSSRYGRGLRGERRKVR
jgi:hypothetical protein